MKQDNICPTCGGRQPSSDQVIVPKEPTKAMCQAGQDACGYAEHDAAMVYRAMLAAAEAEGKR